MSTKTGKIIRYMYEHTGITQMDAYELCKATRLGAIIFVLKQRGYDIDTLYFDNASGCGRYAEYRFTQPFKDYMKMMHDRGLQMQRTSYEEYKEGLK